ncbi:MAG TPA: NADH-quinone oxidoreductase subunit L [Gemmataceae bacterium]|nr:NADH-quinone oxidoreductase subunit L [Gemmataceae bacterium]
MSDLGLYSYLWLIPALPLAAAAVTGLLGPRVLRRHSHWPCILAAAASCAASLVVLLAVYHGIGRGEEEGAAARPHEIVAYYSWIKVGALDAGFALRADALSAVMAVTVTFISMLIAIYSAGYMHDDEGYARFFAEVALFIFSMTMLVLGDNFALLYLGWEGVGLCSYLLIGFWFAKPSAADAARKAFLVTRLGDMGLLIGILLLWVGFGHHLDYPHVFAHVQQAHQAGTLNQGLLTAACLLLLCGAVGKSAQFPLHVWLPDAMEGPSPVSALIHAATMVTAGVYLIARCAPLFELAPDAQIVVACLGGFTAIFAAVIALTQTDLKRLLAYSTLSQLGYMFLAVGCGIITKERSLVAFGVIAAVFHLFTHAFFKALLFLSAGSVMHAMGNVIDMRRFSGLRRVLPITHWTFLCGALSLAGFPLLSGFWSKDAILDVAWEAGHDADAYRMIYLLLWVVGIITAGLTAFYTFRAYFLTFWGEERIPPEAFAHHHGHAAHGQTPHLEAPPVMTVPLMILAVCAVGIGFVVGPMTHWFGHFLTRTPGLLIVEPELNWSMMGLSSLIALGGIGLAWLMYVRQPDLAGRFANAVPGLYQLSLNKFHIDELYDTFILKPLAGFTAFIRIFDLHVLDGLVDLIGHVPRMIGFRFRPVQNGLVQFYALAMVLGLTVFLIALVTRL